ncbi:hypothetical protein BJX70DRAFT_218391 [Aspergillus crustosus]
MDIDLLVTADQVAALNGEAVPSYLNTDVPVYCVVGGIRYRNERTHECYGRPRFTMRSHAPNPRALMSSRLPVKTSPKIFPYFFGTRYAWGRDQQVAPVYHIGLLVQEPVKVASSIGQVLLHSCVADPSMRPSLSCCHYKGHIFQ